MMTETVTREFVQNLDWKRFDSLMWSAFSGCASPVPFYAEKDDILYILDGVALGIYFGGEQDEYDMIDDITELPQ